MNSITVKVIEVAPDKNTEHKWSGTKEELFLRMEKENRSLRYCNGYCFKFADPELKKEHIEWYTSLDEGTKIELYYGGGVVD